MTDFYPTRDDFFQRGANEVLSRSQARPERERLSRAAVFSEGTDINIIIAAASAMADEATRQMAARMAALYLDSAEGDQLTRLVSDRFSPEIVRKQAGPAVVVLSFSRSIPPSPGAAVIYPQGTKFRTAQGTEFVLTQAASISAGSTGPVFATAQASAAGTVGNSAPGTITQFVSANSDQAVTVTNLEPASGGQDVETDPDLRARAREFFISARRGTLGAIKNGALTVQGVDSCTVFEELDVSTGLPTGRVSVSIADINGQSNTVLNTATRGTLRNYRAAGIVVDVLATSPAFQTVAYQNIAFLSGVDTSAAVQQLKALTVAAINLLVPGENLAISLLFSIARSIPGAIVPQNAILVPAGDVVIGQGFVAKTSLDLVSVNGL
jgi:uncharacterized phage protein gp47/JayE